MLFSSVCLYLVGVSLSLLLFCGGLSFFEVGVLVGVVVCCSLGCCVWSLGLLYTQVEGGVYLGSWFYGDGVSALMVFMSCLVVMLSMVCSDKDLKIFNLGLGSGVGGFSVCLAGLMLNSVLFFYCASLFSFYVLLESSLFPTLLLILCWGYQPERLQAGMLIVLYTVGSSMPFLFGVVWLYLISGSDSFSIIMGGGLFGGVMGGFVWLLFLAGFLVKLPMFFLHSWLPKAHVEAPVSGSMILAGILLKFGGFGFWRFLPVVSTVGSGVLEGLLVFGFIGGLMSSVICLLQSDLKALIAYSSVSHMSLVIVGMLSFYGLGWASSVCMMFAHGVCSPCLFALANYSYSYFGSRSMMLCKGLLMASPGISFMWFIFCSLNLGCPPSLNFFSEVMLVLVGVSFYSGFIILFILMLVLGGAYSMHLYCSLNHGPYPWVGYSCGVVSDRMIWGCWFSLMLLFFCFVCLDLSMVVQYYY
uniref:NADH-ubiquinone oxidoreductase chain 4 n=1 Tax=Solen strictus TaxID=194331 RepID=H9M5V7_9BIVA|nr:NADH dehydrogenase subunit 4 [Solen strictus]AER38724.1 NADH dehydrogenase subunit 4 [Solen strictus]